MHTTETNAKNNPITNKAKDIAVPPAKKIDSAGMVPQAADKAKEQMMPVGQKSSNDAAKESCGGFGKDGKPLHIAGCNCASKSASQHAADKPADHTASTMSATKDTSRPNPSPKATEKRNAHQ